MLKNIDDVRKRADNDRNAGRLEAAVEGYTTLMMALGAAQDQAGQMEAYQFLGVTHGMAHSYLEARHALKRAQSLATDLDDQRALGNIERDLGIVVGREKKWAKAAIHFQKSAEILETAGDPIGKAVSLTKWGYVCIQVEEYARANELLRESHALLEAEPEENIWFPRVTILLHMAELDAVQQHLRAAQECLLEARDLLVRYGREGFNWRWAEYHLLTAYVDCLFGKPEGAIRNHLDAAAHLLKDMPEAVREEMRERFHTKQVEDALTTDPDEA